MWINPLILKNKAMFAKQYAAKPFPHIAIRNFLTEQKAAELEAALAKQTFTRKDADLFSFSQTHDLHTVRDKTIKEFLKFLGSKELHAFITEITGVKTTFGKVDASGFIYSDTDYLLCHDDGVSSRRIAYVYNLSTLQKKHGGALALFASKNNRPTKIAKRIQPMKNTLVLFTVSRKSHHQVDEVLDAKRMTITGWFHE